MPICLLSISSCALAESICEAEIHSWLRAGEARSTSTICQGVARLRAAVRSAGPPVDKRIFYYTGNKAVTGTLWNLSFLGCYVPAVHSQKANFGPACSGFTTLKQSPAVRIWGCSLAHPMAPGGIRPVKPLSSAVPFPALYHRLALLPQSQAEMAPPLSFCRQTGRVCAGLCNAGVEVTTSAALR